MLYQNTFQNAEAPAQNHISSFGYHTEADGHYPLHCHAYYEISYLVSGRRYQIIDGKQYEVTPGSFFLIQPLQIHGYKNVTECDDLVIQFSSNFLYATSPSFNKNQMLTLTKKENPFLYLDDSTQLGKLLNYLFRYRRYEKREQFTNNISSDWELLSLLMHLLEKLLFTNQIHVCDGPVRNTDIPQLTEIINRILVNPAEKMDMHEASHLTGISYYNFSRFFKQVTGLGYTEYCNLLRIRYAEEQLLNTDLSVAQIGCSIGIDTVSYFTRLFKKVNGISPSQYKSRYKKQQKVVDSSPT